MDRWPWWIILVLGLVILALGVLSTTRWALATAERVAAAAPSAA